MTQAGTDADRAPAASSSAWRRWLRLALALCVVAILALRLFVFQPVGVVSSSMEPTLQAGDHLLTESVSLRTGSVARGDLVTFHREGSDELLLKRVGGLPGDTLAIRDGHLFVNQRRVVEPYVDHATVDSVYFGPVLVPHDTVFVLGDNRAVSEDSRDFGPVAEADLVGRVAISW